MSAKLTAAEAKMLQMLQNVKASGDATIMATVTGLLANNPDPKVRKTLASLLRKIG